MTDRLALALEALAEALREELRAEAADSLPAPDRLLSVAEATAALGVGRSRLNDEIASGRLRSLKVGTRRLIPASAITDYIADRSTR